MYMRHSLASVETILGMLVVASWTGFVWWLFRHAAYLGFRNDFLPPELLFTDILSLVLVFWLVTSILGYRLNEGYDLNRFRVYPLPLRSIFWANQIGSMLDISILPALAACLAPFVYAGPTFPQFLAGLVLILFYIFFLVLASQTLAILLYVLLPRLSTVRIGVFIVVMVLLWSILLALGNFRHPESWFNWFIFFRPEGIEVFRPYPNGAVGIALGAILENDWKSLLVTYNDQDERSFPLLTFFTWSGVLLILNYLLHALWLDSDVKHRVATSRVREGEFGPAMLKWLSRLLVPIVGHTAFELYRKDMLEYALRSPFFLIYKIFPGSIAPIIIVFAMKWNLDPESGLLVSPVAREAALITMIAVLLFIVIGQANLFAGNLFGFEDQNIRGLMSYPTPRKYFLMGKNLFFAGLFFFDSLIVAALALVFFPSAFTFFAVFSLLLTMFLLILAAGNFTSSIWPYWMPLDKPSFTLRTTLILSLVNMGVVLALSIAFVPAGAIVVLPALFGLHWLSYILMPVAIAYGVLIHRLTMGPAVSLFENNEFLILRRIADREEL